MSDTVISVENLSKAYRVGRREEVPDTLVGAAAQVVRAPLRNFRRLRELAAPGGAGGADDVMWALKDVSFEVKRGEVVGVIGRNGAGKSTLLKILSRIVEPTGGRAVIRGRVSSLLEVGTGFHPELTGRENVYMNGTVLGMTKREIDRKFDEIVEFSGVERHLDTPVKRYSSGMQVRLAFAVAAHLDPEILIVDEVLAVGDAEFQAKCIGKMNDVAAGGRTVLFVSHNMAALGAFCTRGMLIAGGRLTFSGDTYKAIAGHLESNLQISADVDLRQHQNRRPGSDVILTRLTVTDSTGGAHAHFQTGALLTLTVHTCLPSHMRSAELHIGFADASGTRLFTVSSPITAGQPRSLSHVCNIPSLPLNAGSYFVLLGLADGAGTDWRDVIDPATRISVANDGSNGAIVRTKNSHGPFVVTSLWSSCSAG